MAVRTAEIALTLPELREVARYAAGCTQSEQSEWEASGCRA